MQNSAYLTPLPSRTISSGIRPCATRVPGWLLRVALAWGSTLITGVAFLSGESPSPLVFFYLWIFLYSSYFLTKKESAAQIVYVGVVYGALLAARPPSTGVPAWWIVGMGTLLVAAILIQAMRERGVFSSFGGEEAA